MKYLPPNTLAYFNDAPQTHIHNLANLPTSVFAAATKEYRKACGQTSPNDDAVTFYTLNHCASIVGTLFSENEPLPEWAQQIMTSYTNVAMAQGERLLHYLLSITTREMRHLKSGTPAFWAGVTKKFDQASVDVLKNISSNGSETAAVEKYMNTPPDMPIGQYVKTLSHAFHSGSWNGSYGGKPWGDTTDALSAMIHGETSMEMMVDTGYTLAHNGGPIFDKGMMYHPYNQTLLVVLDVQRAGFMLDLMLETSTNSLGVTKTPEALNAVALIKQHKPEAFKGFVDWKLVEALRPAKSKAKYPSMYAKVIGTQKQPMTAKPSTVKAAATAAASPLATTLTIQGKKVKVTGAWQVFPNQAVTTYEREQ